MYVKRFKFKEINPFRPLADKTLITPIYLLKANSVHIYYEIPTGKQNARADVCPELFLFYGVLVSRNNSSLLNLYCQ